MLTTLPIVRNARYGLPWLFEAPPSRPVITRDMRARLEDWLRSDAERMRDFADRPFPSWSVFGSRTNSTH